MAALRESTEHRVATVEPVVRSLVAYAIVSAPDVLASDSTRPSRRGAVRRRR